jgi:4'-phosphopantetheinyl transferase
VRTVYWILHSLRSSEVSPPSEAGLSSIELKKLASMRFPKRRQDWLLGRQTAKRLLQAADPGLKEIPPERITIANEPAGAPVVLLDPGGRWSGCLSISHREDASFCALTLDPHDRIGADLEFIEPHSDVFIQDYLTPEEAARAFSLAPAQRDLWVALAWSIKEAVVKALRIGLRVDTRAIQAEWSDTARPDGWRSITVHTQLPDTHGLICWWRQEGNFVLTLAALPGAFSPQQGIYLIQNIHLGE